MNEIGNITMQKRPSGRIGALVFALALGFFSESAAQTDTFLWADTISRGYTLEELENYRQRYTREISRLENDRTQLRRRGIRDAETFLASHADSKVGDKVMMRLAELYYERSQEDYQLRMMEFDRQFALYERGEILEPPEEPKKILTDALSLYTDVIEKYPSSELVDDSFYNIGFLLEEQGLPDSALAFYQKILQEFPDSPLTPDVYMRLAEYYFNPPVNQIEKAISYYEMALDYQDSPRYDEALYRLGWSYYRLSEFKKAIAYFTLLADDVYSTKPYDPMQKFSNPSLVDESIEYIGLSFLDSGGPDEAVRYLNEIGGRDYGADILKRMGDAYMDEKEDYSQALVSFSHYLDLYPNSQLAPSIQNRIVQAYRRLDNQVMAYLARDMLFAKYKEGSEWWQNNTDRETRKRAYVLTESALRDNITTLLNRGQDTEETDLFEQAVVESQKYLSAFPSDSTAPLIHWNMALTLDTKLKRIDEAHREYLKISNIYWDSKYQRFAAENAVALARDAAISAIASAEEKAVEERRITIGELRKRASETAAEDFNFREQMRLKPTELSPAEIRLAESYDNYIKLFPHAEETPLFLANAGVLYYRHNEFRKALIYFNTLLRHFPGSEEVDQARYAIMESYFGKGDFHSSEIISRRIIFSDAPADIKTKARGRLAESIFLSAEILAEEKQHLAAGNEYYRVVKEVPDSPFADLSLFNASLEYDKALEYTKAIETYSLLITNYPNSNYFFDAQNNLAFDYAELKDYRNAALTYERLANTHPDVGKARDALFNSSLYFAKAKDWPKAIEINQQFVQRFPNDEAADDLAYEIAGFYRNIDEMERMQESYERFVQQYPYSPRTVEALFYRGEYFKEIGKRQNALIEFERAVAKSKELESVEIDRNDYYVAEAEFALAMTKNEEFDEIEFILPEARLVRDKERKKDLLLEIITHLGNCASYGTSRLYEATFMVGVSYQEFAETWAAQEIPQMDATRRIVAQKEVNDAAIELYERAADAHRNTIKALGKLAEAYRDTLIHNALLDTTVVTADTLTIVAQDTVLRDVTSWRNRAKGKLSQVDYEIGEVSLKSARAVLGAPIPVGLGEFPQLVYQKQVIDVAVAPLLEETLQAYQRNIVEADTFDIESQWIDLSKTKLIASKNIVPTEYSQLSMDGLDLIEIKFAQYANLIYSKRSFDELLNELRVNNDEIANIVDFSKACITSSISKYRETIEMATELGIEESYIVSSKDSMMTSILEFSLQCDTLSRDAKQRADRARALYVQTEDPLYEEGLFTFDSNYFTLRDVELEVMTQGYNTAGELEIDNLPARYLALHLVRFDPEQYAGILNLEIETREIVSDTTFKASTMYFEGWSGLDFDDSMWTAASPVPNQVEDFSPAIWAYEKEVLPAVADTTAPDSLRAPRVRTTPASRAFFRKAISVRGLPVKCTIKISADQMFSLYFNSNHIKRISETDSTLSTGTFDVSEILAKGKNLIAVQVVDSDNTATGLRLLVELRSLPDWDERLNMLQADIVSEEKREELMLDKGQIP